MSSHGRIGGLLEVGMSFHAVQYVAYYNHVC
jgi:hypothetical protein